MAFTRHLMRPSGRGCAMMCALDFFLPQNQYSQSRTGLTTRISLDIDITVQSFDYCYYYLVEKKQINIELQELLF